MVQFNELRVTQDGKCLIVDVQIAPLAVYEDVYLNTIEITYLRNADDNACKHEHFPYGEEAPTEDLSGSDIKHFRKIYDIDGMGNPIFLVDVTTKGTIDSEESCCYGDPSNFSATSYAYNKYPVYQSVMSLLNTIDGCDPSRDLIDNLLRLQAFNLNMQIGDYCTAFSYWNRFLGNKKKNNCVKPVRNCGCHGRI